MQERSRAHSLGSCAQEGFECNGTECNPAGLCVCLYRDKHREIVLIGAKQSFFTFFFVWKPWSHLAFNQGKCVCVCLCMHVHGAGPTSSMGVNFISQETSTILYCGDEFPGDIERSVCYRYCSVCSWQRSHGGHF